MIPRFTATFFRTQSGEGAIRRAMIEEDAVECMVALPAQLFINTQIPACLWFLAKDKKMRKGEILFIDARKLGRLENRVNRLFDDIDIERIAETYHSWKRDGETEKEYEDILGFCKSANIEEIRSYDYLLTPGRYVGAETAEDNDEVFSVKMARLTQGLATLFDEGARLESEIKRNLEGVGFEIVNRK